MGAGGLDCPDRSSLNSVEQLMPSGLLYRHDICGGLCLTQREPSEGFLNQPVNKVVGGLNQFSRIMLIRNEYACHLIVVWSWYTERVID